MMNRYTELLFWIGRYLERAEHYARTINTYYHKRFDPSGTDASNEWERLTSAIGDVTELKSNHPRVNELTVLSYLTFERSNMNSIVSSVQQARNNIRSLRQLLPGELWEIVNSLYLWLKDQDVHKVAAYPPYAFYKRIGERISLFNGVAESTMVREESWSFIQTGRYLERMRNTLHMLHDSYGHLMQNADGEHHYNQCIVLLKACGGYEAFRKFHANNVDLAEVASFLLINSKFPRSVQFARVSLESYMETNLQLRKPLEWLSNQVDDVLQCIRAEGPDREKNANVLRLLQQMLESCNKLSFLIAETCFQEDESHAVPQLTVLVKGQ